MAALQRVISDHLFRKPSDHHRDPWGSRGLSYQHAHRTKPAVLSYPACWDRLSPSSHISPDQGQTATGTQTGAGGGGSCPDCRPGGSIKGPGLLQETMGLLNNTMPHFSPPSHSCDWIHESEQPSLLSLILNGFSEVTSSLCPCVLWF